MIVKVYYTPEEIDAGNMLMGLHPARCATVSGYVAVKHGGYYETYDGKFGKGFIYNLPSYKKRGSHEIIYYLENDKNE